jgi:hypothetical protein
MPRGPNRFDRILSYDDDKVIIDSGASDHMLVISPNCLTSAI